MKRFNVATHPKLAKMTCIQKALVFTQHASQRALEKGVLVPRFLTIQEGEVVEVELVANQLSKLVMRRAMNKDHDLVLVLIPRDRDTWTVITCWLNRKEDTHRTLRKDRLSA
jgi:hypothetical protein